MNSQDKLGLTVCYRTDDEEDIGIYISEVGVQAALLPVSHQAPKSLFYVLTDLNSGSVRNLWKDTDNVFVPFIARHGVTSLRGG